jgi:hypothetical protein
MPTYQTNKFFKRDSNPQLHKLYDFETSTITNLMNWISGNINLFHQHSETSDWKLSLNFSWEFPEFRGKKNSGNLMGFQAFFNFFSKRKRKLRLLGAFWKENAAIFSKKKNYPQLQTINFPSKIPRPSTNKCGQAIKAFAMFRTKKPR